jgi:hypothetical protein
VVSFYDFINFTSIEPLFLVPNTERPPDRWKKRNEWGTRDDKEDDERTTRKTISLLVVVVAVDDLQKQDREQDRRELAGSYTHPPTLNHYLIPPQHHSFSLPLSHFFYQHCWKSASLAGKRIRFGTNRVTISEPIGWRVIQLPRDLHLIHTDVRCVYLILSLFPTNTTRSTFLSSNTPSYALYRN